MARGCDSFDRHNATWHGFTFLRSNSVHKSALHRGTHGQWVWIGYVREPGTSARQQSQDSDGQGAAEPDLTDAAKERVSDCTVGERHVWADCKRKQMLTSVVFHYSKPARSRKMTTTAAALAVATELRLKAERCRARARVLVEDAKVADALIAKGRELDAQAVEIEGEATEETPGREEGASLQQTQQGGANPAK
jgi:hypothetical protein